MLNRLQTLFGRLRKNLSRVRRQSHSPVGRESPVSRRTSARFSEVTQYTILAGYCRHLKPGGSILDLGCGEGLLHEALEPRAYALYVGVDRSEAAIRRACFSEDDKSTFVVEDLGYYIPRERFDVIVLGQSLGTLSSPLTVVRRYSRYLKQHGVFLAALPQHDNVWSLLDSAYHEVDSVRVSGSGTEYLCKVYSAQSAPGTTTRRRSSETPRSTR